MVGGVEVGKRGGFIQQTDRHSAIQCFYQGAITGTVQQDQIEIVGDGHAL